MIDTQYKKECKLVLLYLAIGCMNVVAKLSIMATPFIIASDNYMTSEFYTVSRYVDMVLNCAICTYVLIVSLRLLYKAKYNYFYAYLEQRKQIIIMTTVLISSFAAYIAQDILILNERNFFSNKNAQWFIFAFQILPGASYLICN